MFNRKPEFDEIRAKPEKLSQFGWMLNIDILANHDITKWAEVMNQSYERIIIKLLMNREREEYQQRYKEIIQNNK
ncbi:hypothetical protein [Mucilaginibacter gracilis]|uniref:hypothetical protein n=1 Tax=Mucilaginibacter gracilis TaxID=423350 RepID=UPI000EB1236B|nr:hypothetical protein [Mucilaginibacter gracilis]